MLGLFYPMYSKYRGDFIVYVVADTFYNCWYNSTIRSLYVHVVCMVSCKVNGDGYQLGCWETVT